VLQVVPRGSPCSSAPKYIYEALKTSAVELSSPYASCPLYDPSSQQMVLKKCSEIVQPCSSVGTGTACGDRQRNATLDMVDTRSEGRDVLKLKRCAEELLRGVQTRTRPNDVIEVELAPKPTTEPAACGQQSTPQVCPAVSPFSPKREPQEVINHALKEVRNWISGMPQLFWVAVSLPHMMARIYWCAIMVLSEFAGEGGGHAKPSPLEGVRRVVSWLKPLLKEFPPKQIQDFLIKTRVLFERLRRTRCLRPRHSLERSGPRSSSGWRRMFGDIPRHGEVQASQCHQQALRATPADAQQQPEGSPAVGGTTARHCDLPLVHTNTTSLVERLGVVASLGYSFG